MQSFRTMSHEEIVALWEHGVVNATTAPFAPVQADEDLHDTRPRPPAGTILLWSWVECVYHDDWDVEFAVPEHAIVWRGIGAYHRRNVFSDEYETIRYPEIGVRELRLEWIVGIEQFWE